MGLCIRGNNPPVCHMGLCIRGNNPPVCHMGLCIRGNNLPDKPETWSAAVQVFGKDSILHLGGVETADSREAWAADTNMEVRPSPSDIWAY